MRYKLIIVIIAMLLLNGLNNSREINDLAIVSSIGIDKLENGDYRVSAIVLNPEKQGSGSGSSSSSDKMTLYEGEDTTIQKAIRKMVLESPKKLYLSHMELLLVSESVAKDDLVDSLDFFIRDNEGSNDFLFVVSRDIEPREVLQIKTPVEDIPSENIVKSIEVTARYMGTTIENDLNDSLENILEEGEDLAMPSIIVKKITEEYTEGGGSSNKGSNSSDKESNSSSQKSGKSDEKSMIGMEEEKKENNNNSENKNGSSSKESEKSDDKNEGNGKEDKEEGSDDGTHEKSESDEDNAKETKIYVDTLAYFKDKKLKGYLTEEQSMVYCMLRNKFKEGVLQINDGDNIVVEILKCGSKMTPKYENNEYIVDIDVNTTCTIAELGKDITFDDESGISKYEDLVEQKLKSYIEDYISSCQNEYDTDLIGFGKLYREKLNREYKKVKDNFYPEIFKNIKTNINVKASFPNDGGINKKW